MLNSEQLEDEMREIAMRHATTDMNGNPMWTLERVLIAMFEARIHAFTELSESTKAHIRVSA